MELEVISDNEFTIARLCQVSSLALIGHLHAKHWLGLFQVNILVLFIWLSVKICLNSGSLESETEKGFGCTW